MLHGQVRYNIASRFFDEIPDGLVHWLSPRRRTVDVDPSEWGRGAASSAARPVLAGTTRGASNGGGAGPTWRIGQTVRHVKFGVGIIIDAEGRGADARVQVNFRGAGVKWLVLEYAKLQAA
jgi:DNA helicase-2/ATP-dependent DNA helicase PcrA